MPKEGIGTRIEKKTKQMFKAKCDEENKRPYTVLRELINKYVLGTIDNSPSSEQIETLMKEREELIQQVKRAKSDLEDKELEAQSIKNKYNIDDPETWQIFKNVAQYAFDKNLGRDYVKLGKKELELVIEITTEET